MEKETNTTTSLEDYEDYLKLRQQQIMSKDFARKCREALEKHYGKETPILDIHF